MTSALLISRAAGPRLARAKAWLEQWPPGAEVLVIGPASVATDELLRACVLSKGAAFGWHRTTLVQLAATLATPATVAKNVIPVSALGALAVATRVVEQARTAQRLGRYADVAEGPGFARAIAAVIEELRLHQVEPQHLCRVAPDLAHFQEQYAQLLEQSALIDRAGLLALAAQTANAADSRDPLLGLPTLFLDLPVGNAAEQAFVAALATRSDDSLATAAAGDESSIARLSAALACTAERAESSAEISPGDSPGDSAGDSAEASPEDPSDEGTLSLFADPQQTSSLVLLQRHLFREDVAPAPARLDNSVTFFSAPGESRECVEIARAILGLARKGASFDRIAVLLRVPEEYRAHIEEAFARAGIPVFFARGARQPDPAGRAFLSLLACAVEGLSARRFAEYLSLGQSPQAEASGAPPPAAAPATLWMSPDEALVPRVIAERLAVPASDAGDLPDGTGSVLAGSLRAPRRWERLLVEAAVIGGESRWRARIAGLAEQLRRSLADLEDPDDGQVDALERNIADLDAFADYALPLIEALAALPAAAMWSDWIADLGALATRALREPQRVLSVLSEFTPMSACGPVALDEVARVLSQRLLELPVPPDKQRYGRVFVGPVESARGMHFSSVFVPGLAEKMFPRKISEEPILLDAVRKKLAAGLDTNAERVARERLALMLAAGAADEHLCLSYPRLDLDQSRPRVPSFYALEALRAAEGHLPDFAELAQRAEAATASRVGWPAPADPAQAIDDAEHDLALLQRILQMDPEQATGTARYLLSVNPHLGRALRFRARRWLKRWTAADGLVDPSPAGRAAIAKHRLDQRSFSPTALQHYSACPYRFLLNTVHKLAPREVPEAIDQLDPLQRGSLVHDVQFVFFTRLAAADLLPLGPARIGAAQDLLDVVVGELAAEYKERLAPAIERVWDDGIEAIRADLREWLRRHCENDDGFSPWRFELGFGLANRLERGKADPNSVPGPVALDCGLAMRGSIDVLERSPDGRLRASDYKTGKNRSTAGQIVGGGGTLQPVLYALVAEKIFGGELHVESGRLDFCTSAGGFATHTVALDARARESAQTIAETIAAALEEPFLPAAPAERQCEWCDYKPVCGPYEEQRSARKPQDRLEPLLRLRALP